MNDDPCAGCGMCCADQGTPPGYAMFLSSDPPAYLAGSDDERRWLSAPESARREVQDAFDADRSYGDGPCCWYDTDTRRCRHHASRPSTCREFDAGSDDCRTYRVAGGLIPLPLVG